MATDTRKVVIGLVGGIGSGKSAVARHLAGLGCGVIDADRIARDALDDPDVKNRLVSWWGPDILDHDGRVNRKAVGARVFDRPQELQRLEDLIHPRVYHARREIKQRMQADPGVVAIVDDTPLLMEKHLENECDVIVFVDAPRPVRLARLAKTRGWDEAELARREKNQLPLDIKRNRADHVISNDSDEPQCASHVRRLLSQIIPTRR